MISLSNSVLKSEMITLSNSVYKSGTALSNSVLKAVGLLGKKLEPIVLIISWNGSEGLVIVCEESNSVRGLTEPAELDDSLEKLDGK